VPEWAVSSVSPSAPILCEGAGPCMDRLVNSVRVSCLSYRSHCQSSYDHCLMPAPREGGIQLLLLLNLLLPFRLSSMPLDFARICRTSCYPSWEASLMKLSAAL
jgi:hypothetical protein